jgi:hypothetical protein
MSAVPIGGYTGPRANVKGMEREKNLLPLPGTNPSHPAPRLPLYRPIYPASSDIGFRKKYISLIGHRKMVGSYSNRRNWFSTKFVGGTEFGFSDDPRLS